MPGSPAAVRAPAPASISPAALKIARQRAIRELVARSAIGSQQDLVEALRARGHGRDPGDREPRRGRARAGQDHPRRAPHLRLRGRSRERRRAHLRCAPPPAPRRHPRARRPERPHARPHLRAGDRQLDRPGHRPVHPDRSGRHAGGRQYAPRAVRRRGPARALAGPVPRARAGPRARDGRRGCGAPPPNRRRAPVSRRSPDEEGHPRLLGRTRHLRGRRLAARAVRRGGRDPHGRRRRRIAPRRASSAGRCPPGHRARTWSTRASAS